MNLLMIVTWILQQISHALLSQGFLCWFDQSMSEVLVSVNNIKLNKEADRSWIKNDAIIGRVGGQSFLFFSHLDHRCPKDGLLPTFVSMSAH